MMNRFIPVKITDKKYADRFVKGEIYMRSLHEFGSWGDISEKDQVLKNDYRGDLYAGVTAVFASPNDCKYFQKIAANKQINKCCLIDESDTQYFKILSLYCWEFDDKLEKFISPDPRMAKFGDTAVVILDICEFLDRYAGALFKKYPQLVSLLDRVETFDFNETKMLNPIFCKHVSQAYQNELRIAFGELEDNIFARGSKASEAKSLIMDYDPVILQLGDLSDIVLEMPINYWMAGSLPKGFRCRWPSNPIPQTMSNFDTVRAWTKEQMKNYRSIHVRPTYTVDGVVQSEERIPFIEFIKQCN